MVCCMGAEPADGLLWLMCGGNKMGMCEKKLKIATQT